MTATPATLRTIWPTFAAVTDETIQYWLDLALPAVDGFDDRADHAQMLLADHYMTVNGIGAGTDAQLAAQGLTNVQMIRSSLLHIQFQPGTSTEGLMTTTYGKQFLDIARAFRGGAMVTPTGTIPGRYGRTPWPC